MEAIRIDNSSQIVGVAYDAADAKLFIEYKPGKRGRAGYAYNFVPPSEYDRLREVIADPAQSVGSFIAREIKPRFTCTPLSLDETAAIFGDEPAAETTEAAHG